MNIAQQQAYWGQEQSNLTKFYSTQDIQTSGKKRSEDISTSNAEPDANLSREGKI